VIAVDLETGNRRVVVNRGFGNGPALGHALSNPNVDDLNYRGIDVVAMAWGPAPNTIVVVSAVQIG
jgi:hypothetical protein